MDEVPIASLDDFQDWKYHCIGNLPHGLANIHFEEIEGLAMQDFEDPERCLYDLYAFYKIRDIPTLTRKMNYMFSIEYSFRHSAIDRGLRNVRKMVSLKYLEQRHLALMKEAEGTPLSEGDLPWDEWAKLSAAEAAKSIGLRARIDDHATPPSNLIPAQSGYSSGFFNSENSSSETEDDSEWESDRTRNNPKVSRRRETDSDLFEKIPMNETKLQELSKGEPLSSLQEERIADCFPSCFSERRETWFTYRRIPRHLASLLTYDMDTEIENIDFQRFVSLLKELHELPHDTAPYRQRAEIIESEFMNMIKKARKLAWKSRLDLERVENREIRMQKEEAVMAWLADLNLE